MAVNTTRFAGVHFPNREERPSLAAIARLPGVQDGICLMLATEGRYHWQEMREAAPNALLIWRAIPRQRRLPADLGWEPNAVARECLNLWDEAPHEGREEWFQPLNELQFTKESGETFRSYRDIADKLAALRPALRREFERRGQTVNLIFPPWVPQEDYLWDERLDEWLDEAMRWDGVGVHVYGNADVMRETHARIRYVLQERYSEAGTEKPIGFFEWNANHSGADERAMLEAARDICAIDQSCLGFAYYIWETRNEGEQDLSVWGNEERLGLFVNPPAALPAPAPPAPVPEPPAPEPTAEVLVPTPRSRDDVIATSNAIADELGIPRLLLLACGVAESNLRWNARRPVDASQDAAYWPDVSGGCWQQTVRYDPDYRGGNGYPGPDETERVLALQYDVERSARVAAENLKDKLQKAMGL